jgi:4-hydroxy-tetrahydrodipicolinate synthase
MLSVGARGVVSVAANVAPAAVVAMVKALERGDVARARSWHQTLMPLFKALFIESNPGPVKHALARLGLIREEFRLPLVPIRPESARSLDPVLDRVNAAVADLIREEEA